MTIQEIEKELSKLFGDRFFQFAFYVDGRKEKAIGKYWVKVETELDNQEYKAWQARECESLEEAFNTVLEKIKASNLLKKQSPQGVSQWLAEGKKYGYVEYWLKKLRDECVGDINKRKDEVRKSEGAFKYDWCFQDCIKIINKQ